MVVKQTREFAFGTFNGKGAFGGMKEARIKHDLQTIDLRSKSQLNMEIDVLGLQEWMPEHYSSSIREVLGPNLFAHKGLSPAVWTSNESLELISSEEHPGHEEVVIDGKVVANNRPIEVSIVKDKATGLKFAVVSGHPVPGAFLFHMVDGKRVWDYKPGWRKRRAAWRLWRRNLLLVIKSLSVRGLPVFVALDANKSFPPALLGTKINNQAVRYVRNGIDWMIFVDSVKHRWDIDRKSKWIVKALFSDHDAILVKARLLAK